MYLNDTSYDLLSKGRATGPFLITTMKGNITPEQQQVARIHMGAWLKERREECGLSQSELARQLGIDQATVNKIEAGKWAISIDMLEMFLIYYGASVKDMFVLTEIKN